MGAARSTLQFLNPEFLVGRGSVRAGVGASFPAQTELRSTEILHLNDRPTEHKEGSPHSELLQLLTPEFCFSGEALSEPGLARRPRLRQSFALPLLNSNF